MSFKKIKEKMVTITDTLTPSSSAINQAIKEVKQYLNVELSVVKESKEGINALKEYAEAETPSLKGAISALANKIERIENAREEKVAQLQEKFVNPLNKIVEEAKILNNELKEAENAKKALEKAERKLEKLESKPIEKLKPGQLDDAKSNVKSAKANNEKEEAEAKRATETFNKKRLDTIQLILKDVADIENKYHEKALKLMGAVAKKVEKEPPIPSLEE